MTSEVGAPPGMIARGLEAEHSENRRKGQDRFRGGNAAQEVGLGVPFRESSGGEAEAGDAEQGEQESNDGGQNASSAFELGEGFEELLSLLLEDVEGDDRPQAAPPPGRDSGARDGDVPHEGSGAGAQHVLAEAMVIGAAHVRSGGRGWSPSRENHPARVSLQKPE